MFEVVPVALFSDHFLAFMTMCIDLQQVTLGPFHLLLNSVLMISIAFSTLACQNYILLDFLRDIHHFDGLAGGAQRYLNVRWEKERKKKPSSDRREDIKEPRKVLKIVVPEAELISAK